MKSPMLRTQRAKRLPDRRGFRRPGPLALACLLLGGCAEVFHVQRRVSQIRLSPRDSFTTSDPAAKNRYLRQSGSVYEGMVTGLSIRPNQIVRLSRTVVGDVELMSADEGIILHRRGLYDDTPAIVRRADGHELYWATGTWEETVLFRAASGDGYLWTDASQVLGPTTTGGENPRDAVRVSDPTVIRVHETWFLYFAGTNDARRNHEIFLARSVDGGKTWVKHSTTGNKLQPTAVIPNDDRDDTYGLGHPSAIVKDDLIYLWYTDRREAKGGLWLAVSQDGIRFESHRQVAPLVENADVKFVPALGVFLMVYGEVNDPYLYWSLSPDGVAWEPHSPERRLATGPPETVHHSPALLGDDRGFTEPETRVFYTGGTSLPGSLEPQSWEIESSWLLLRRWEPDEE